MTPLSSLEQYLGELCSEVSFIVALLALLVAAAYELGRGVDKKELAAIVFQATQLVLSLSILLYILQGLLMPQATALNDFVIVTSYNLFIKILTATTCLFILYNSRLFLEKHDRHILEYSIIYSLATLFILLLLGTVHLIAAFMAIVGFSLNIYVLILADANSLISREAGAKYLFEYTKFWACFIRCLSTFFSC